VSEGTESADTLTEHVTLRSMSAIPSKVHARPLPTPSTLEDAVQEVIDSNRHDNYSPNIFVGMVRDDKGLPLKGQPLIAVCKKLINKPNVKALEDALKRHPYLLTIEDLVCRHGEAWGLDSVTIQHACDSALYFDSFVGHKRYS